jgi:hypothetical protein
VFQKITTWLVIGILGFVPFLGAASAVGAQSESGFPEGIVVEEIASGEVPPTVMAPGALTLERIVMPANTGLPARQVSAIEILYVEEGRLTIADSLGLSSPLAAENSVALRPGSSYTAINDGASDVSFLRLSLVGLSSSATPAAIPIVVGSEASGDVEVTALANFDLTAMPASPTILFLSRATWGAGVDSGEYTQTGPIGMLTESGTLTISSPSGIEGQLGEGQTVLLPADQVLRTRNDGTEEAVALLFGVIPAEGGVVTTSESVPEVEVDPSYLEDISESTTTASDFLYQADTSGGLAEWAGADGWQTVSGMLVNDGRGEGLFKAAPFEIPVADYAIEVEMQFVRGENRSSFGVVAREHSGDGYFAGYHDDGGCGWDWKTICLWGTAYGPIGKADLVIDSEWHVYRLEVQGNTLRVFVDGTLVIETSDNSFLSAGKAGLWSNGAQVNVRRFSIIALGDG